MFNSNDTYSQFESAPLTGGSSLSTASFGFGSLGAQWFPYAQDQNPYIPVPGAIGLDEISRLNQPLISHSSVYPNIRSKATLSRSKSKSSTQKKKLRKSDNQLEVLRKYFKKDPKPGRDSVQQLADTTGLNFYEVRNWFRNARLRNKGDELALEDDDKIYGEVSSSTGSIVNDTDEICKIWKRIEHADKLEILPKMMESWEKNSTEKNDAIKVFLKNLTSNEKVFVQNYVKPRGPYRCSGYHNLSKTTILERAKNAWRELERMFGANKRTDKSQEQHQDSMILNLDRDMMEGLKSLFQAHRDYLYYLVKELGIEVTEDKDCKLRPKCEPQLSSDVTAYTPIAPNQQLELFSPSYSAAISPLASAQGYQVLPAAPTPIYPGALSGSSSDYIPYGYNTTNAFHSNYSGTPLQSMVGQTNRSPWLSAGAISDTIHHYPTPPGNLEARFKASGDTEFGFMKSHFSPEKYTQSSDNKSMIKPFSDIGGPMASFNTINNITTTDNMENHEITQKCTLVKYYEVSTTYNKSTPGGGSTQQQQSTATNSLSTFPSASSNLATVLPSTSSTAFPAIMPPTATTNTSAADTLDPVH